MSATEKFGAGPRLNTSSAGLPGCAKRSAIPLCGDRKESARVRSRNWKPPRRSIERGPRRRVNEKEDLMAEDDSTRALRKRKQISISVIGRRTGRSIKIPVWFVFDANTLWLLPVYGSQTQWFRNLQASRII